MFIISQMYEKWSGDVIPGPTKQGQNLPWHSGKLLWPFFYESPLYWGKAISETGWMKINYKLEQKKVSDFLCLNLCFAKL